MVACDPNRFRRDIESHDDEPAPGERANVAPGPASDVEHGTLHGLEQHLLIRAGLLDPSIEKEGDRGAVGCDEVRALTLTGRFDRHR